MAFILFDPMSAMAVVGGAQALGKGIQEQQQYEAQAQEVHNAEKASTLQYSRDQKDMQDQTDAGIARRRALLAANGGAGTAQATALLDSIAATGGQNQSRMKTDYQIERSSLRARRANLKTAGQQALANGIFGAAAAGAKGFMGGGSSSYGGTGNGLLLKGSNGMLGGGV